ncbi:MAG: nucleotide pyrophosphohydrolase [archaeon GB-1867-035]|nr:nucleotide pyrophosphohydrolase [Candidatus Culexmicrobium profundum]
MLNDSSVPINFLKNNVKNFVVERDWEKYHNPKDLAVSISVEAGELLEIFQWRSVDEIMDMIKEEKWINRISEELADIFIYILSMANVLNIDLTTIVLEKLKKNAEKYPVEKYKGRAFIT